MKKINDVEKLEKLKISIYSTPKIDSIRDVNFCDKMQAFSKNNLEKGLNQD